MTAVPIAEFAARPLEYLRRTEAGEQFEIVRDGRPVVRMEPAIEADETDDIHPREMLLGLTAPAKPLDLPLPSTPVVLERRPPEINLAWFPPHDDE